MDGLIFTKNKGELLEKFSKSVKSFMKRKADEKTDPKSELEALKPLYRK